MTQEDGTRIRTNRLLLIGFAAVVLAIAAIAVQARAGLQTSDRVVTEAEVPADALPAYQAAIFADGRVTFEEYRQAASDTVSCIRSNGVKADDPVLEDNRTFSFIVEVPDGGDSSTADSVVSSCMSQFYSVVQMGWADEIRDPAAEDAFNQVLLGCLEDGGVQADKDNLLPALEANQQLFDRCTEEARELTTP